VPETAPVRHGYLPHDGLRLHYLRFGGSGRPIVSLHGVTGSGWDWHHVGARLSPVADVTAMDLRGHGDSQWSASAAYDTSQHVGDVLALLDQLSGDPVDLMGYSWGALIALALAARQPERVSRLVLVDVEASFQSAETDVMSMTRGFSSAAEVEAACRAEAPHGPAGLVSIVASGRSRPGPGGLLIPKHDAFFFDRWPFRRDDRWADLRRLRAPTLAVHAEASFVRCEVMTAMAAQIPDVRLVHLPGTTHVVPVDNPEGLAGHVAAFLRDTPDRSGVRNSGG
jgi:pimeloyl-ACP methyl ester carboxylesterase